MTTSRDKNNTLLPPYLPTSLNSLMARIRPMRQTAAGRAKRQRVSLRARGRTRVGAPRAKNKIVNVPKNKLAFPTNIRTTLRYSTLRTFSLSSNTSSTLHVFSANNMRDPDVSGGGHQPRGFDEFMARYGSYTVHGASCSYHFSPLYTNGAATELGSSMGGINAALHSSGQIPAFPMCIVGIHKGAEAVDATLPIDSAVQICEQDKTKWTLLNGNTGSKILSTKINVADYHGTSGSLTGREGYFGGFLGDDPERTVFFTIFAQQHSAFPLTGDTRAEISGVVTIEYDVTFSEPKALGES